MKYFWLTIKHKWFVFLAGRKIGVPIIRLILHDWTKFLPCELPHYQRQFFGKADDALGFIKCWIHHQNHNDHHWEYWIARTGHNRCEPPFKDNDPIPMSEEAVREMVADWMGAGRAYEGKWPDRDWAWLKNNMHKMVLHQITLRRVVRIVDEALVYVRKNPED